MARENGAENLGHLQLCTSTGLQGVEQIRQAMVTHSAHGEVELTKEKGEISTFESREHPPRCEGLASAWPQVTGAGQECGHPSPVTATPKL